MDDIVNMFNNTGSFRSFRRVVLSWVASFAFVFGVGHLALKRRRFAPFLDGWIKDR